MDWHWHWRISRQFRLTLIIGIVLLIVAGVLPYFIPIQALDTAFRQALNKSTQRTLSITDGAYFVLLPSPTIILKKVTLTEANSDKVFLSADRVKINVDLWPLFSSSNHHADIEGVTFKNAQFTVIRHLDGNYNFDNIFAVTSDSTLLKPALKSINFDGSHVKIMDESSQNAVNIDDLDLGLNDLQDPKLGKLTLAGKLLFSIPDTWKGNIEGSAALRLDRKTRILDIADLGIKVMQNYDSKAQGGWEKGILNINGNLRYGWQPLRLSGGDLVIKGKTERADQSWQTKIVIPSFKADDNVLKINNVLIDTSIAKGNTVLTSKAEIRSLSGNIQSMLHTDDARINMELKQPSQTLQLYFESPMNLMGAQSLELPGFRVTGYYRNQSLPRGTLTFSQHGRARIDFWGENLLFISNGFLDKSPMTTELNMQGFFIPHYQFSADLARLDLTPYLPVAIEGARSLSTEPYDFSWLNDFNAQGNIRIGTLKLQRVQMSDVDLGIQAGNRILTVSPLNASIYNGTLKGELTINNQGKAPQLRLKQRFSNVDISPLFTDMFKLTHFDGRGYLDIDIAAAGNSRPDWQRTIGGTVNLSLARGTFKGLDILNQLRQTGKQLDTLTVEAGNALSAIAKTNTTTNFSSLKATLFIQKGIIYNKDLTVKTGLVNLMGEGTYDIIQDQLDYTVNTEVNPQNGITEFSNLIGYTLPIHFSGSLPSPNYQFDYAHLRQQIEKRHGILKEVAASVPQARKK